MTPDNSPPFSPNILRPGLDGDFPQEAIEDYRQVSITALGNDPQFKEPSPTKKTIITGTGEKTAVITQGTSTNGQPWQRELKGTTVLLALKADGAQEGRADLGGSAIRYYDGDTKTWSWKNINGFNPQEQDIMGRGTLLSELKARISAR